MPILQMIDHFLLFINLDSDSLLMKIMIITITEVSSIGLDLHQKLLMMRILLSYSPWGYELVITLIENIVLL
jgi:hypothetical protein